MTTITISHAGMTVTISATLAEPTVFEIVDNVVEPALMALGFHHDSVMEALGKESEPIPRFGTCGGDCGD